MLYYTTQERHIVVAAVVVKVPAASDIRRFLDIFGKNFVSFERTCLVRDVFTLISSRPEGLTFSSVLTFFSSV
jgi:hypothetical protein